MKINLPKIFFNKKNSTYLKFLYMKKKFIYLFKCLQPEFSKKQVRTNIGLADTLIPSSFIYLIYMRGTGPCGPMTIILGSVI